MREIIKLGLILLLITSIAAIILGLSNNITEGKIEKAENSVSEQARIDVLSEAEKFLKEDSKEIKEIMSENPNILEVYKGIKQDELVGYAIKTSSSGYSGEIEVITGISTDGIITGVNVVNHSETPGLGANATSEEFQGQFIEVSVKKKVDIVKTSPKSENEVQALTGATITSDAVGESVNIARQLYIDNLE